MNQTTDAPLNGTIRQQDSLIREEIVPGNKDKRDAAMEEAINALRRKWTGRDRPSKHPNSKQEKP